MALMPESDGQRQTLAAIGKEIHHLFEQLSSSHLENSLEGYSTAAWEHEAERFGLWANNLGLHHRGHSSLDYRLREAEALKKLIDNLLDDLKTSLCELREIAVDSGCITSGRPNTTSYEESPQSESGSDDDSSDEEFASSKPAAIVLLDSVTDVNDSLYRLATKVRNPATRLPKSKARLFKRIDQTTGVDSIAKLREADLKHMQELFWEYHTVLLPVTISEVGTESLDAEERDCLRRPRTLGEDDNTLISRFASANTYRRQQFGHWRRHRDKKAKETAAALNRLPVLPIRDSASEKVKLNFSLNLGTPLQHGPNTLAALSRPSTASHLQNPSRFEGDDIRSITSARTVAPKAMDARDESIDVPLPPDSLKDLAEIKGHFECPYCFTICSASQLQPDAWREHVFRDLRPYVCTYVDCPTGDQVYDSWKDWTTHERWVHNRAWRCAQHASETYYSAAAFKQHVHEEHSSTMTVPELDQVLHSSEIVSHEVDRECPFCSCNMVDADQLQNHIATHLQRIALFALPRSHDIQDASEAGSSSSQVNAYSQGSQDLGSEHDMSDKRSYVELNQNSSDFTPETEPTSVTKLTFEAMKSVPALEGAEDRLWHLKLSAQFDPDNAPLQIDKPIDSKEDLGSQGGVPRSADGFETQQDDTDLNISTDPRPPNSVKDGIERAKASLRYCLDFLIYVAQYFGVPVDEPSGKSVENTDNFPLMFIQIRFFHDLLDSHLSGVATDQSQTIQTLHHTLWKHYNESGQNLSTPFEFVTTCQSILDSLWDCMFHGPESKLIEYFKPSLEMYPQFRSLNVVRILIQRHESIMKSLMFNHGTRTLALKEQNTAWLGPPGVVLTAEHICRKLKKREYQDLTLHEISGLVVACNTLSHNLDANRHRQNLIADDYYTVMPSIAHTFDDIIVFLQQWCTGEKSNAFSSSEKDFNLAWENDVAPSLPKIEGGLLHRLKCYNTLLDHMNALLNDGEDFLKASPSRALIESLLVAQNLRLGDHEMQAWCVKGPSYINLLSIIRDAVNAFDARLKFERRAAPDIDNEEDFEALWAHTRKSGRLDSPSLSVLSKSRKYIKYYYQSLQLETTQDSYEQRSEYALEKTLQALENLEDHYRTELAFIISWNASDILEKCALQEKLAVVLCEQGKMTEAKELVQAALETRLNTGGADAFDSVTGAIELGQSLCKHGELEAAAEVSRALRSSLFGDINKSSLSKLSKTDESFTQIEKLSSLVMSLWSAGEYLQASELQFEDFRLRQHVLGNEDLRTLESADRLASMLRAQGRLVEAENEYQRLLSSRREVLGETHHQTLDTLDRLVLVLFDQDKFEEARSEIRTQALKIRRTGFGPNLVSTVLKSKEDIFGKNHPLMLFAMENLAVSLFDEGFRQEASDLNHQVLQSKQISLGSTHPDTLESLSAQSRYLRELGKSEEADSYYERAVDLIVQTLDVGDPEAQQRLRQFVEEMLRLGEGKKAENCLRRAVYSLNISLNEDSIWRDYLIRAFQMQGKDKEADDVRQRGLFFPESGAESSLALDRVGSEITKRSDSGSDQESQHVEDLDVVSGSPDEATESEATIPPTSEVRQGKRQYKISAFRLPNRDKRETYMSAFELARILGFNGTSHLLDENPSLSTIVLGPHEVNSFVERDLLPSGGKHNLVMVRTESAILQFGHRITHYERHGEDDDPDYAGEPTVIWFEGDDILIMKHKTALHTLHFQTDSIENGLLTVGDVRKRAAAVTWWGQERHRVTLYFQGRRLRHDQKTCREEGLKNLSEVECITNATSKRSGDSITGVNRSDSYNPLGPLAPSEEGRSSLPSSGITDQSKVTDVAEDPTSPQIISAASLVWLLSCCPENILLFDLRADSEYRKSHISGASNLFVPGPTLSHQQAFIVDIVLENIAQEREKRGMADWRMVKHIVAYDTDLSLPYNPIVFMTFLKGTALKDWKGTLEILLGGFATFATEFPNMISSNSDDQVITKLSSDNVEQHEQQDSSTSRFYFPPWDPPTSQRRLESITQIVSSDTGDEAVANSSPGNAKETEPRVSSPSTIQFQHRASPAEESVKPSDTSDDVSNIVVHLNKVKIVDELREAYERDWFTKNMIDRQKATVSYLMIREGYKRDWLAKDMIDRQKATASYLMVELGYHLANKSGDAQEQDFTAFCSLRLEQVRLESPDTVTIDFRGKGDPRLMDTLRSDAQIMNNLRLFMEAPKRSGDRIFDRLTTSDLKTYFLELTGPSGRTTYPTPSPFVEDESAALSPSSDEEPPERGLTNQQPIILEAKESGGSLAPNSPSHQ